MFARIVLIALTVTGCTRDYGLQQDPDSAAQPEMLVDPHQLTFYDVSAGDTEIQTFSVSNVGSAGLELESVEIDGASAFTLLTDMPRRLEPDESLDVEIAYSPLNTEDEATARITSTDPLNPTDSVELVGTWAVPELEISPSSFDFGDLVIDCTDSVEITLTNVGTGTLEIDEILHTGEGFEMSEYPSTPLELEPDESTSVNIEFAPLADLDFQGTLWVSSNDPAGTKQGIQTGGGDPNGVCITVDEGDTVEATLEMSVEHQVADVAFLVDTTGSMGGLANAVANEYSGISASLRERIPDITFGVATYDDYNYGSMGDGQDRPFILRQQQTSDFGLVQGALSSEVTIHSGGDSPESTMEALYQAATGMGYDQTCNGGYDSSVDVPPFIASSSDAFGGSQTGVYDASTPDGGEIGGFGFRDNVLPIVIFATDAPLRDPDSGDNTPGGCPFDAGSTDVLSAMNSIGGRIIAVGVNVHESTATYAQMEQLASGTGSTGDMDGDGTTEPAVITWSGSSSEFQRIVVDAVDGLVGDAYFDEVRLEVVGEDYGMVKSITPEAYYDLEAGTEVEFDIEFYGAIASEPSDQTVEINFELIGYLQDDDVLLDTKVVYVMIPQS